MLSTVIVDDEMATLKGIGNILRRYPDEFQVILSATSAIQALDFLEKQGEMVDAVITDIHMPVMDGVEFVGVLAEKHPHIKAVVLSGYSDFDYVRACMKKGAVDYLLKPCRYQVLVSALRKISRDKKRHMRKLEQETTKYKLRQAILSGEGEPRAEVEYATLSLYYLRATRGEQRLEEEAYIFLAESVEIPEEHFFTLGVEGDALVVVDATWRPKEKGFLHQQLYLQFAARGCLATMAYVEQVKGDLLVARARESMHFCRFAEFNNICKAIPLSEKPGFIEKITPSGFEENLNQDRVLALVHMESDAAISRAYAKMTAGLYEREGYLSSIELKKATVKLVLQIEKMLPETSVEAGNLEDNYSRYTNQIWDSRSLEELLTVIRKAVEDARSVLSGAPKSPRYIGEAIAFIKSHYMEDLHLADVSKEVFLNEWYFSSQFKKHVGVPFKEYLNETRIESAKKLLTHQDLKIGQIAEMVGFSDPAYFATAFKGVTGKTPKEYRKTALPAAK